MKKVLLLFCSMMLAVAFVKAQKPEVMTSNKPGWHKIGDATVDFKTDNDQFAIMGADRFKSLRVKVLDAPVHMEDMQVTYEGKGKPMEDIAIRSNMKAGGESRVINLKNRDAEIKRVSFKYHTVPNAKNEKAHIELWGLK